MKCKVSHVGGDESQINLISFQNGRISEEGCYRATCGIYREETSGKKVATVTINNGLEYRGYEMTEVNQHSQLLVAVRNRNTNKVRLFPVSSFLLAPVVQGSEKSTDVPVANVEVNMHKEIDRTFGSKRSKRTVEYGARMATGMKSLTSQLNNAVSQVNAINEQLLQNSSSLQKDEIATYLPPCNRDAVNVADVYKLDDIITVEEMDSLRQEAIRMTKETEQISATEFSLFFRMSLLNLLNISGMEMLIKLCTLLYTESLISFLKTPIKCLQTKRVIVCPYSGLINQKILTDFTSLSDKGRVRPNTLRDKAICHIIVLGLLLCNYELDLQLLSQSLAVPLKRLVELSRVAGAVLKSRESSSVVVLKLPLPERQLFSKQTKRSRRR